MEELIEKLKELSGMLERDPKLWMEIESIFRSVLSEDEIAMSSAGNLIGNLRSLLGQSADLFRLIGMDQKNFLDFQNRALEEGDSIRLGLELIRHIRHVHGQSYRRAEIMARYGPMAWFSTSVSVGKGGDVMIEISRADGERFTVHLRDKEMLKKFLESMGRSLELHGIYLD